MASASPSSTTKPPQTAQPKPQAKTVAADTKPKNDLEKANALKEEANLLVKGNKPSEACERYFEAINTLRFSEKFKNSADGKAAEMACRLNIALCKHTQG